ncbi:phage holin family protein [Kocuria rhizophila]|uniref:phage holin family protein n=1 Tax=Kocuria rhizophila TaxID=72000 RepID=UPI00190BF7D2|nr:phage holin family protein [Kocuria rhizophila]MBK4120900.1 phage holin family protein [Kocuria rhizophila]
MSHAVGPNSGHSPTAANRSTKRPGAASITDVVKVFVRLLPKQLKDEAQLAVLELKEKGIKVGVGAAFAVVGLVFLGLAVIALIGAAIAGLSHVMPAWLAALLLAVVFLVVLAVLALIGVSKIKSALPLMPEKTIFGLRYDLGVVKEGSAYSEGRVQRDINEAEQRKQREKEEAANDPNRVKPVQPTEEQLRHRLKLRREHLKSLRDDAQNRVDSVQSATQGFVNRTSRTFTATQESVKSTLASKGGTQGVRPEGSTAASDVLSERWQPLAVAVAAGTAFLVFLKKLLRK